MLVYVSVWTPQNLTAEQKEFFEKAKTDSHFSPSPEKGQRKSFYDRLKSMFK